MYIYYVAYKYVNYINKPVIYLFLIKIRKKNVKKTNCGSNRERSKIN